MSRRGLFPLLFATFIGVGNGIWVFGPAIREQQLEREEDERKSLEFANSSYESEVKILRDAQALTSKLATTTSALKPEGQSGAWWSRLSLWSRETSTINYKEPSSSTTPRTAIEEPVRK